jgi:hypothetical protein
MGCCWAHHHHCCDWEGPYGPARAVDAPGRRLEELRILEAERESLERRLRRLEAELEELRRGARREPA